MGRRAVKILFFIALYLLAFSVALTQIRAQQAITPNPDDIVITEIMANPQAVSDNKGEWFEIYNTTSNDIDLAGCTFSDNGTNDFTITTSTVIAANNYFVLGRNDDPETNGGLTVNYPYSGFTLANDEDEIIITCSDAEIDRVEYSSDLGFTITAGASLILADIESNNNSAANWCTSTSAYGRGDLGTPGQANDSCAEAVDNENGDEGNNNNSQPKNHLPFAQANGDTDGIIGQPLNFDGIGSYDPDGDALTFTWDLGDGTIKTGQSITHAYNQTGVWQVRLTVNDGRDSRSSYLTVKITTNQTADFTGKIIINELMPNPEGADDEEWIELKNISEGTINLAGLTIKDGANKTYTLNFDDYSDLDIAPQGFFLITKDKSKIILNNAPPETVTLLSPEEKEIDSVTYETKAKENYAYALINNDWLWTDEPTPGKENLPILEETDNLDIGKTASSSQALKQERAAKPACQPTSSEQIILSELWPSPQGDDRQLEFIEIKNESNKDVDLCDWILADKNNNYSLPMDSVVPAQGYLLVSRADSKISLNNSGDVIKLYDYKNKLVDKTSYPQAKTDLSWSRNSQGQWSWTNEITPEEENIFNQEPTEDIVKKNAKKKGNTNYIYTTINSITDFEAGQQLIVEGWVTAPPGILGSQIMYVTGSGGLQIYQHKKDWPQLDVGDKVKLIGTLSYPYGRPRLKISSQKDIIKLKSNVSDGINILNYKIDELGDELLASLINVSGEVVEKTRNKLFIDDGSAEIEVYIKSSTGIVLPDVSEGDILEVIGILNKSKDRLQLLPRFSNDIKLVKVAGWSAENTVLKNSKQSNFVQVTNFLYITLIGLIILLSGLIYKLKRTHGR